MSNGSAMREQSGSGLRSTAGCLRRRGAAGLIALVVMAGQPLVVEADAAPERYVFYLAAQPNRSLDATT